MKSLIILLLLLPSLSSAEPIREPLPIFKIPIPLYETLFMDDILTISHSRWPTVALRPFKDIGVGLEFSGYFADAYGGFDGSAALIFDLYRNVSLICGYKLSYLYISQQKIDGLVVGHSVFIGARLR